MKRCFILLVFFCFIFVSASVEVDSYYVDKSYVYSDDISGQVNLTIDGEGFYKNIELSDGNSLSLIDFLDRNAVDYYCSPADCSVRYDFSSGNSFKSVVVPSSGDVYLGFVLNGGDILLDDIAFNVSSDFGTGEDLPLSIEFFEASEWVFSSFSDELLSKNWGCFEPGNKEVGPLVGSSFYCEIIDLESSAAFNIGAEVVGSGGELNMALYPEGGFGSSWECSFDPSTEDGCIVNADSGEVFESGTYQVCVGADSLTSYNIYQDNSGSNCGFSYVDGPDSSTKDYAIFAQGVKYADASNIGEISFDGLVDSANYIISERYGGDCSDGCVLPLKISGVPQNFKISDVNLVYTDDSEWKSDNLVYSLTKDSAEVYFNGTLDLSFLGLGVFEDGEYYAILSGEDLFRDDIELLPAPVINSIRPYSVPAAVPVVFYANVEFEGNQTLSYTWDFGDGKDSIVTDVPYVDYVYDDLGSYVLSLSVSAGGNLTFVKNIGVEAISPEDAVASGLEERKKSLIEVRKDIKSLPGWYQNDVIKILELDDLDDELARLERSYENSIYPEEFRDIAVELWKLNIPVVVSFDKIEMPFLMTELSDIDLEPVANIAGNVDSEGIEDSYANAIIVWQNENIVANTKIYDVSVTYSDGSVESLLTSYDLDVSSSSYEESYFVINKPFGELYFNGDAGERKSGDDAVIILDAEGGKSFQFYYKDDSRGKFFVSPALRSLVVEEQIDKECNFNLVCEEDNGENPENCRSDCKPVSKAVVIFILLLLFLLVVYTGLQIWYKRNYEKYLFKDKAELYNLVMYISNARARGIDDKKISRDLISQGWSMEKVEYAIRKSLGKNIGMVEIIPIEKISAWLRNRRAKKNVGMPQRAAPVPQSRQQRGFSSGGFSRGSPRGPLRR